MGILIRHQKGLEKRHGFDTFLPLPRPFSSCDLLPDTMGCSVNFEPYFALNAMLQQELFNVKMSNVVEHNNKLCSRFLEDLVPLGAGIIGSAPRGSIATVSFGASTELLHRELERHEIKCHLLNRRYGSAIRKVIRFGFHYFHSEYDVFKLSNTIEEELFRVKSRQSARALDS